MSFNKTFSDSNKFILGSTKLKSAPSTAAPTLSVNNDDKLVITSVSTPSTVAATTVNVSNSNNNTVNNDELISILENINHTPLQPSSDDKLITKLISGNNDDDEIVESSSSSDAESEEEVKVQVKIGTAEIDEKDDKDDKDQLPDVPTGIPHESSSQAISSLSGSPLHVSGIPEPNEALEHKQETAPITSHTPLLIPQVSQTISNNTVLNVETAPLISNTDLLIPDTKLTTDTKPDTKPTDAQPTSPTQTLISNNQVIAPSPQNEVPEEIIPFDFQKFLKQLRSKDCDPIVRYIKSFIKQFGQKTWSLEEQEKLIKDFEIFIFGKFIAVEEFKDLNQVEITNVKEGFEKLIMSRLYTQVFPPALVNTIKLSPSHKEVLLQDLKLLENLIRFQWIENRHLDIPDSIMDGSQSFFKLSSNELNKLNNYKSPRDKIICILNCCKVIFGLIRKKLVDAKLEENADTFVPLLIYIILKSKPKHLISNIEYIEKFRGDSFLNGESMYYLSSLQLLANFIVKVDSKLLTIDEEEYNSNISRIELELKLKKEEKEKEKKLFSPAPLLAGKFVDERLQDLSPSQILATSANVLQQKFSKMFAPEEQEGTTAQTTREPEDKILAKVKKMSIKEHQELVDSDKKLHEILDNLKSIFPNIDDEILKDIIVMKNYNIGNCIDSCLELLN